MLGTLIILLIVTFIWGLKWKTACKAMGNIFQKKGYTLPSDKEIEECSTKTFKQMLHLK